ncbi:MAG: hypothetical protein PSN44_06315 [Gammaproteobacteria bacterium]|nr:hypothetical protein [Gammaproteobacteria bacterium]
MQHLKTGEELRLRDGVSHPPFGHFLSAIPREEIAFVEVGRTKDCNENVEYTLTCNLYLKQGVIRVEPDWCGYKELRSSEIVSSLLLPLIFHGLMPVTMIDDGERLDPIPDRAAILFNTIFELSGYPRQDNKEAYITQLSDALEIAESGLRGVNAFAEWDKRSKDRIANKY